MLTCKRLPLLLALVAFALRLAYIAVFVGYNHPPEYDGIIYDHLARALLDGSGYVNYWGEPAVFRPPVYPLFLAGVYAVSSYSLAAVRVVQAALDAGMVLVVYAIARLLFGSRAAALAGLGVALYPLLIYETGLLIPETLSYMLQFGAILLLLRMAEPARSEQVQRRPSGEMRALFAGFLIGLAVLARPTAAAWAPLAVLWVWWPGRLPRAAAKLALMTTGLALVFTPWIVRNALVFDAFIPISGGGAFNIWAGNNPLADGGSVAPSSETWNGPDAPTRGQYGWEGLSEVESNRRFAAQGWAWIRDNPGAFARLVPRKLLRLWSPLAYAVQFRRQTPAAMIAIALPPYLVFLALAAAGIVLHVRAWRRLFPLLAVIISVNVLAVVYFGASRYALPMVIALIIFTAATLDRMLARWWNGQGRRELPIHD